MGTGLKAWFFRWGEYQIVQWLSFDKRDSSTIGHIKRLLAVRQGEEAEHQYEHGMDSERADAWSFGIIGVALLCITEPLSLWVCHWDWSSGATVFIALGTFSAVLMTSVEKYAFVAAAERIRGQLFWAEDLLIKAEEDYYDAVRQNLFLREEEQEIYKGCLDLMDSFTLEDCSMAEINRYLKHVYWYAGMIQDIQRERNTRG